MCMLAIPCHQSTLYTYPVTRASIALSIHIALYIPCHQSVHSALHTLSPKRPYGTLHTLSPKRTDRPSIYRRRCACASRVGSSVSVAAMVKLCLEFLYIYLLCYIALGAVYASIYRAPIIAPKNTSRRKCNRNETRLSPVPERVWLARLDFTLSPAHAEKIWLAVARLYT